MPRTITKWLVVWYGPDGKSRGGVERSMMIRPATWAKNRCAEGETYKYFNISNPEDEKAIRAELEK